MIDLLLDEDVWYRRCVQCVPNDAETFSVRVDDGTEVTRFAKSDFPKCNFKETGWKRCRRDDQ
jgi:hypothetical protein